MAAARDAGQTMGTGSSRGPTTARCHGAARCVASTHRNSIAAASGIQARRARLNDAVILTRWPAVPRCACQGASPKLSAPQHGLQLPPVTTVTLSTRNPSSLWGFNRRASNLGTLARALNHALPPGETLRAKVGAKVSACQGVLGTAEPRCQGAPDEPWHGRRSLTWRFARGVLRCQGALTGPWHAAATHNPVNRRPSTSAYAAPG